MLQHMEHRGGCGCEDNTGDGAGMLTALPYGLIERIAGRAWAVQIAAYTAAGVFMPTDPTEQLAVAR